MFTDKSFRFVVFNPDLAFLKLTLTTPDAFGDPNVIGLAVFAFQSLRDGVRSIPLKNSYMEPIEKAALLVDLKIEDNPIECNFC